MAGSADSALAIAVAQAGGLGALACAMLSAGRVAEEVAKFRLTTGKAPINLNFFCHEPAPLSREAESRWQHRLRDYYEEFNVHPGDGGPARKPFDDEAADLVTSLRPDFVSFHFGLPDAGLLERVRASGARVLSSATTIDEAVWLDQQGIDGIIVQGLEAGGHRGQFLRDDLHGQAPLLELMGAVRQHVSTPFIGAGGIDSHERVRAVLDAGAIAVQVGTVLLRCPEATTSDVHRAALAGEHASHTAITNIFSGRPARGIVNRAILEIGPLADEAPPFPWAAGAMASLRRAAEARGSGDFSPLWSGTRGAPADAPAAEIIESLLPD